MGNPVNPPRRIGLLTAWASRANGGVFEAVAAQADMIRAQGGEPLIFALDEPHAEVDRARFGDAPVSLSRVIGPAQMGFAPGLLPALLAANLDCLHLHGIWMYPSRAGMLWARATDRPYIISPHGMMDPWITARGRWKKAAARIGYERASWRAATALHALTPAEVADMARETGRADAVVIPNAGPAPSPIPTEPRAPHVAYIGRIHPKKNLGALVQAWRQAKLPPDARLTIAGWGAEADVALLQAAVAEAGPTAQFIGPIYGQAKQALLAGARFTILPSLSEGLPMAVLEGWAAGTPAIITPACHLPEGLSAGAALPCGPDAASIAAALETALTMPQTEWLQMAGAAHGLASTRFAAATVAARWAELYGLPAGRQSCDQTTP